jgi:hypothetical protein
MNATPELDYVFPLSSGSSERTALRAPRLPSLARSSLATVMSNRAFMRTWAARRAAVARAARPDLWEDLASVVPPTSIPPEIA